MLSVLWFLFRFLLFCKFPLFSKLFYIFLCVWRNILINIVKYAKDALEPQSKISSFFNNEQTVEISYFI